MWQIPHAGYLNNVFRGGQPKVGGIPVMSFLESTQREMNDYCHFKVYETTATIQKIMMTRGPLLLRPPRTRKISKLELPMYQPEHPVSNRRKPSASSVSYWANAQSMEASKFVVLADWHPSTLGTPVRYTEWVGFCYTQSGPPDLFKTFLSRSDLQTHPESGLNKLAPYESTNTKRKLRPSVNI